MNDFLINYQWELWALAALIFLVLELTAGDFFMLCLAVAAALAAVSAGLGAGFLLNLGIFAVVAVACLFFLRPRMLRRFGRNEHARKSNADALTGREATVSETIPAGGKGYVAIDGDRWPAVSAGSSEIKAGEKVKVIARESIVLTVMPLSEPQNNQ